MTMMVNWGRYPSRPADPGADLRAIRRDTERIRDDTERIRQRVEEVLRTQQALLQRVDRLALVNPQIRATIGPEQSDPAEVSWPHGSRFRALEFPPAQEGP
ncbi:MAG: hypothetical protein PHG84_07210 [Endomicrobiaceae bacterium]|jgi:hypothetical protein|nr:hypothetical protein [Endomicrobiaceae bacterium]